MSEIFAIKSTRIDGLSILLKSQNFEEIEAEIKKQQSMLKEMNTLPFILDVRQLADAWTLRLDKILPLLKEQGINIIALKHHDESYGAMAQKHELPFHLIPAKKDNSNQEENIAAVADLDKQKPTIFIDKPIRSGQQIYAEDADLIISAMVSEGAEIIADGNIHVYAPMRGRALAGASGNTQARIFVQCMGAQLVSIAGIYRTFDTQLPESLQGKPVGISLTDGRLAIIALKTD